MGHPPCLHSSGISHYSLNYIPAEERNGRAHQGANFFMSTELNQTSSCLGVPSSLSSSTGIVQVADEDQMDQTCLGYRLRALFDVFRCSTLLFRSSCLEATVIWPQRIRRAQSGAVSTIYSRDGEWIHTEFNGFRISPPYHIISYAREPNYPQIIPNEGR